ncbi:MAG: hypothetical protein HQL56_19285 [Magnetococcales bacterium]|nr:hypothetical protein [Magnetococcales bacterium]
MGSVLTSGMQQLSGYSWPLWAARYPKKKYIIIITLLCYCPVSAVSENEKPRACSNPINKSIVLLCSVLNSTPEQENKICETARAVFRYHIRPEYGVDMQVYTGNAFPETKYAYEETLFYAIRLDFDDSKIEWVNRCKLSYTSSNYGAWCNRIRARPDNIEYRSKGCVSFATSKDQDKPDIYTFILVFEKLIYYSTAIIPYIDESKRPHQYKNISLEPKP